MDSIRFRSVLSRQLFDLSLGSRILELLLQFLDDSPVLDLALDESLFDDAHFFLEDHAFLFVMLHLRGHIPASLVVVVGSHVVFAHATPDSRLIAHSSFGGGGGWLLGAKGAIGVKHFGELGGV